MIALTAVIGLGFGIFSIAESYATGVGVTEVYVAEEVVEPIIIPLITKLSLLFAGLSIGEYLFLRWSNNKLKIWDNQGDERDNILSKCDVDTYEDSVQVRIPKKISFFKAIRCKLSDVATLQTMGFGNTKTINIKGTVEKHGNFYVVGNSKLARGLILLEEGSEVDVTIKTKVNLETALGIYRIYDVLEQKPLKVG